MWINLFRNRGNEPREEHLMFIEPLNVCWVRFHVGSGGIKNFSWWREFSSIENIMEVIEIKQWLEL